MDLRGSYTKWHRSMVVHKKIKQLNGFETSHYCAMLGFRRTKNIQCLGTSRNRMSNINMRFVKQQLRTVEHCLRRLKVSLQYKGMFISCEITYAKRNPYAKNILRLLNKNETKIELWMRIGTDRGRKYSGISTKYSKIFPQYA